MQIKLICKKLSDDQSDILKNMYLGSAYGQKKQMAKEIDEENSRLISQFTFVDLAGSEKLEGEHDPQRVKEAKFINKSLSALGNVIQALKNKHNKPAPSPRRVNSYFTSMSQRSNSSQAPHIPYRDSKLTHILKTCLNNGNSMTHLVICLSPCENSQQECISTMKFAENAKSIQ